jgi:hypothetical protein
MSEAKDLRTREDYLRFLEARVAATSDEAEREILRSGIDNAAAYERSISPLGTLARVVEACDAIHSGDAASLARSLKQREDVLRPGRTPINSRTVDAYIRLRELADQRARTRSEWVGPRDATIRRTEDLKKYVDARRDAIASKVRPSPGSRARRVEEILGRLESPEDRQDLRFTLEQGYVAQRQLTLLRKAIETNFPAVDLNAVASGQGSPAPSALALDEAARRALAQLAAKLQDPQHLRHFGLTNDGRRIKLSQPPGTQLIEKAELETLMSLLKSAIAP